MEKIIKNGFNEFLKSHNISNAEFANTLNINHSIVNLWVSGLAKPTLQQLIKICKLFNVSAYYVLLSENRKSLKINHLNVEDKSLVYNLINRFRDESYRVTNLSSIRYPLDIHDKIKYLRTNVVHLTQNNFGSKINVSRDTIKHWESGISKPNTEQIIIISLLCNVSIDYLIFDDCPEQLNLFSLTDTQYKILSDLIFELERS